MRMFNKFLAGALAASLSVITQAKTGLEIDHYGGQGPNPYDSGAPWVLLSTEVFTEADGIYSIWNPYSGNPDYTNSLNFSFRSDARRITVSFSTDKLGTALEIGTYVGAQRFPFNSPGHPGLDRTDTGSGFNTLDGQFQIFDVGRNAQGVITNFAASFEIFNFPAPEGSPLVGGRVWFDSDAIISPAPDPEIPTVPEPNILVLLATMAAGAAVASKRRSRHDAS